MFKVSSDLVQLSGIRPTCCENSHLVGENSKEPHLGPSNIGSGSCLCSLPELYGRDAMPMPCLVGPAVTSQFDLGLALSLQTCLVITGLWMTLVPVTGPALFFLPRHSRIVPLVCEATAHLPDPLALSSCFPAEQLTPAAPPAIALWALILRTTCTC